MKKAIIITGISTILISSIIAYRYFVPPNFKISNVDNLNHTGIFEFDGNDNYFGNGAGTVGGRMGWTCEYRINSNNTTTFNLLKNGKFVKELATV